jgi:hypothetical protein
VKCAVSTACRKQKGHRRRRGVPPSARYQFLMGEVRRVPTEAMNSS